MSSRTEMSLDTSAKVDNSQYFEQTRLKKSSLYSTHVEWYVYLNVSIVHIYDFFTTFLTDSIEFTVQESCTMFQNGNIA